jgi:hypothetical protein
MLSEHLPAPGCLQGPVPYRLLYSAEGWASFWSERLVRLEMIFVLTSMIGNRRLSMLN